MSLHFLDLLVIAGYFAAIAGIGFFATRGKETAERYFVGGRFYTSFGFLTDRIFDLGVTLVTTALAINVLTGWDLRPVILGVGVFTIPHTLVGGMEIVVWTDVVQGVSLMFGGLFILGRLMFAPEAGALFTGWLASQFFGGHRPDDVDRLTYFGLKQCARPCGGEGQAPVQT